MTVYGYLRVSTDKQDCDNQKVGVKALAEKLDLPIESWIIDNGVSGTKEPEKRQLGKLLKKSNPAMSSSVPNCPAWGASCLWSFQSLSIV